MWLRTEDRNPDGKGFVDEKRGRPLIDDKAVSQERADNAAARQVVYENEGSTGVQPVAASGSSPKLLDPPKPKESKPAAGALPPAPPPSFNNSSSSDPSSSGASSDGVPQLF